jgi:glycerol-3-phosphate acyltransferase PlsY
VLIALAIFAFLLGSIPFGVIVSRAKGVDIFSVGSGNIGATNVIRAVGPVLGIFVFLLDVLKGFVPGVLAHFLMKDQPFGIEGQTWSFILGSIAIVGHMFSPWIGFKGGKGVATGLGAMLSSIPITGLLALAVMIPVTAVSRYVSLGSIIAALSTIPISHFVAKDSPQVLPILLLFNVVVIVKHRSNIARIFNGTENKFRFKKNDGPETKGTHSESKFEERKGEEDRP